MVKEVYLTPHDVDHTSTLTQRAVFGGAERVRRRAAFELCVHPSLGFARSVHLSSRTRIRIRRRVLISAQRLCALPLDTLATLAFAQPPIRFSGLGSATLSSRRTAPGRGKRVHLSSPLLARKSCGVEAAQEATEPSSVGGEEGRLAPRLWGRP